MHWLPAMLTRWTTSRMSGDEALAVLFLAFLLHLVFQVSRPPEEIVPPWPRRVGFTGGVLLLIHYVNLDGGIANVWSRLFESAVLGWFLGGLVGLVWRPAVWAYRTLVARPFATARARREQRRRRREEAAEVKRRRKFEEEMDAIREIERRQVEEAEEERRREEAERQERERPERERREREEAERRRVEREESERRRRVRDGLRLECTAAYDRLRHRFPEGYDQMWFGRTQADFLREGDPEDVQRRRAAELIETLETVARGRAVGGVAKIRQHFDAMRRELAESGMEGSQLEQMLAKIAMREAEALANAVDDA